MGTDSTYQSGHKPMSYNNKDKVITACIDELISGFEFTSPADLRPALAAKVKQMLDEGAQPSACTRLITSTADRVMELGIDHALENLGPAPAPWMFMVMGSEGRIEQTLRTDQDSAIVWKGDGDRDYFVKLGEIVSEGLNAAGFLFCNGNVMASNPKWVMSIDSWKRTFSGWVEEPDPMAIMQACIFFDFRCGYGAHSLESELGSHISGLLGSQSELFFYHMAKNALSHSVPLGWFGRLNRSASSKLDVKKAMLPLTDHARIYALSKGLKERNTLERIRALDEQKAYRGADAHAAKKACEFMTGLRLRHQIECIEMGKEPDNIINPSAMSDSDRKELIRCLKISKDLRQSIEINFRAGY